MKRVKTISRSKVLEAHVQQGVLLTVMEKQLDGVMEQFTGKTGEKEPVAAD